jgi:hypothetical protein
MQQYGDFVTKTAETGIKFQLPGSSAVIEATAIESTVTIPGSGTKPAITKPMPDPKTVFETPAQLDAFEKHARPFIAAKVEAVQAQVPPLPEGKIFTTEVPVKTSAGEDAMISIEIPWYRDTAGKLNTIPTWWLAKSNFTKGGAFNP